MYTFGEIVFFGVVLALLITYIFIGFIIWNSYNKWVDLEKLRHSRNFPSKS